MLLAVKIFEAYFGKTGSKMVRLDKISVRMKAHKDHFVIYYQSCG